MKELHGVAESRPATRTGLLFFLFPLAVAAIMWSSGCAGVAAGGASPQVKPAPTPGTPLAITVSSLPSGTAQAAYSASLSASGGSAPYSWSVTMGSLPPGLALPSSGQITGTPTQAGSFSFTVQVIDSGSPAQSATQSLNLTVAPTGTSIQVTTTSLAGGQVGSAYSVAVAASGGTTPYIWSLSAGALPNGLTLSDAGQISGTPTAAGPSSFTIKVTDSSAQSATANLSLAITVATGGDGPTVVLCPNNGETGNNANCAPSPTLSFGKQGTGTTSAVLSISVNNCSTSNIAACTGTGSLTLGSPHYTITGPNAADFSNTGSGTCSNGLTVNSGSDCTIVLRFTPSQGAGTNESATLTVNSNGVGNPHTMSLTGTSAAVATISSCQNLNGGTNYQLTANVNAPGTCFSVGGSNTDINLNGFTVTYCTSSQSGLVGGVFMTGNPTSNTIVHNGTINEGAGTCTGGNLHGAGPIIASSDGQSSVSHATTVFNITSTFKAARGKFVWEEEAGGSSSSGTTIHDVIYTNNDSSTCGSVSCRDQDQYYSIVIDQSKTAAPTQMYNVTGSGGTQGAIVSSARNSQFYNNFVTSGNVTSTNTNGFIFQDWGAGTTIRENLTTGSGMGGSCLSCRGVQVSSANNVAVTGSVVQDNVLYTTNLNNDVEYGGCEIGGSYGIQINTAGSSSDLSNNTVQNNRATVTSSVCPGYGFSWSGATAANGPNKTNNNTFTCNLASGFTAGPCAGIRLDANQYNPGIAAVVGTGDTYKGDTSAIYIFYDGSPTWTCNQCTFGKGSNPISGWVMLDYDGGGQSGASSEAMFLVDPSFTDGATQDSNNLSKWASNNGSLSFSYTVQWTYRVTVKGASSGSSISGATVTARDSKGAQECSGPTDASGVFSCVVNDTKYAATSGSYTTTSYSPFAISIAKPGCTTLNYNLTLGSPTTETRTVPGC
jgi:Putative Ig domain